ncbi:ankyrin, partial [Colletotrichum sublineola]
ACKNGDINALETLLTGDISTQVIDNKGRSLLYMASRHGQSEAVRLLLAKDKGNIDYTDPTVGWTALHIAIYYGHKKVVEILLEENATLKIGEKNGWTPLMTATIRKHLNIMRLLLDKENGIRDLEVPEKRFGRTPLLWASMYGFTEGVTSLINAKAN